MIIIIDHGDDHDHDHGGKDEDDVVDDEDVQQPLG